MIPVRLSTLALVLCLTPVGCAQTPARAVRPDAPTAREGLGDGCTSAPLVVDLPPHERAALEATFAQGRSVLVRYDCRKLVVLPGCDVFVGYDYAPLSLREDVVRMRDGDEVRAHLPLTGAGVAAELSGELARGRSLDLALVTAGRHVARATEVFADAAPAPACSGATHFVSVVSTGAFAMSVGARAEARAVAEIFGAGGEGRSESHRTHASRDGDLETCRTASRTPPTLPIHLAPVQCRAPLRLELRPIDRRSKARASCEDQKHNGDCLKWLRDAVQAKDQVQAQAAGMLALSRCRARELAACWVARSYADETKDRRIDGAELDRLECELGHHGACTMHGQNLIVGGKTDEGFAMLSTACFHYEESAACWTLATFIRKDNLGPPEGPARQKLLSNLHARGCETNEAECARYGELLKLGFRAEGEFRTMRAHVAACDAYEREKSERKPISRCAFAAAGHALGLGVPRDLGKAKKAWATHCQEHRGDFLAAQAECTMPASYLP